ncbi:MAG: glutamate-5-semialdehyde dehydrogenase [Solobacterium sp.]|nr:glutamate-5-semialdehyde dehydrogenase [Solobacterium sp.]MBQ6532706.1 glutamate-5-semialdehyde dehydrogenase [Solobacterium sp.]MBR0214990.1 glutamate-5-semialdehyde dehydrogenase [Solobacterium sp.]
MKTTREILQLAHAEAALTPPSTEQKNQALAAMADALERHTEAILAANRIDMEQARGHISEVMLDRLMLNAGRIKGMADGIRALIDLPDPAGRVLDEYIRADGLVIRKVASPIGVIAVIYESRPNVTSDAAALIVKSGSTAVLRSGKEAWNSAHAVVEALHEGLLEAGLHAERVQLVEDRTRASSNELMTATGLVDLLIPRGGAGLIKACVDNATVPVIETGTGICHIYVDDSADLEMALKIIENAKCSRPSVCNAEEVLLVHEAIAPALLPRLQKLLTDGQKEKGRHEVELRLDPKAMELIPGTPAGPDDFDTEFLDYILAVKVVGSLEEAMRHIQVHSTHHSEAILTGDQSHADLFTAGVDSAAVYVNASTRFTDGGEFGLGCEMGISTQKLHARGPMGLAELCTSKYVILGSGHIR